MINLVFDPNRQEFTDYRHLEWELNDGDILDHLNIGGSLFGVRFRF